MNSSLYFQVFANHFFSIFRIQREQDFLRASLRESKKLQNLEKKPAEPSNGSAVTADGFVNRAFDRDAEEASRPNGASGHSMPSTTAASAKEKALEGATVDIGDSVSKCWTLVQTKFC